MRNVLAWLIVVAFLTQPMVSSAANGGTHPAAPRNTHGKKIKETHTAPARVQRPHAFVVRHYLGWTRVTQYIDCCVTASGQHVFYGEVAADPSIHFGAQVVIPGLGSFVVLDRGGAVYGAHVDVWVPYVGYHNIRDYYPGVYWYMPHSVG